MDEKLKAPPHHSEKRSLMTQRRCVQNKPFNLKVTGGRSSIWAAVILFLQRDIKHRLVSSSSAKKICVFKVLQVLTWRLFVIGACSDQRSSMFVLTNHVFCCPVCRGGSSVCYIQTKTGSKMLLWHILLFMNNNSKLKSSAGLLCDQKTFRNIYLW